MWMDEDDRDAPRQDELDCVGDVHGDTSQQTGCGFGVGDVMVLSLVVAWRTSEMRTDYEMRGGDVFLVLMSAFA